MALAELRTHEGESVNAAWQRVRESRNVLDADAVLRQTSGRLIADAIMCNPSYVLTVEQRERLIEPSVEPAAGPDTPE